MQAILTRYHGATNYRGSRISATCERGRIYIDYPHEKAHGEEAHRAAAQALVARFIQEDAAKYGTPAEKNPWAQPFVSGGLPSRDWAHVFTGGAS